MKPSKAQIKDYLDRLQKTSRPLLKASEELNKAVAFKAELEALLDGPNKKNYTDAAAIQQMTTARTQLYLCEQEIERLKTKTRFVTINDDSDDHSAESGISWVPFVEIITEGQGLVAQVLQATLEVRLETIKACIRPFFARELDIDIHARKTDAYCYGFRAIQRYCILAVTIRIDADPAAQFARASAIVRNVLTEAVQDSPNLTQFLPSPVQAEESAKASA